MGILNVTPDSFYDGGKYLQLKNQLKQVEMMLKDGASVIDVGGMSSRPGSTDVAVDDELKRVLKVIASIHLKFPEAIISIDTWNSSVAEKSIANGASVINDISGGTHDSKMFGVAARYKVPFIINHMKGTPAQMQKKPSYEDVTAEVNQFFKKQIDLASKEGVEQFILDPGFGFGKSLEHNFRLLKDLELFKKFSWPLLVGISRKSMVNQVIDTKPSEALNGSNVLNSIAIMNGASLIRTHDVKETIEAIKLIACYHSI